MSEPFVPPGHFYSPLVDPEELRRRETEIWRSPRELVGIDFQEARHEELLEEVFPRLLPAYDYVERESERTREYEFYTRNSQFSWLDSRALFVLLQHWRPSRIIEVGSGFSSLLMADVNRRFMDNAMSVECIEPFPRDFLQAGVPGITRVLERQVQDVPLDHFRELMAGDVLFIDSSHVCKTGSDVHYLYLEVMPRLADGVIVHVHDIFLPVEYPRQWVLEENRSWNEQYLVRAMLVYSRWLEVEFGCTFAEVRFPELVAQALGSGGRVLGGGSLWLRKTSSGLAAPA